LPSQACSDAIGRFQALSTLIKQRERFTTRSLFFSVMS
jgi:hypothetical protein